MSFLDWLTGWMSASGFAGIVTIAAACIALAAMRHQTQVQRASQDRELWWRHTEWALTLAVSGENAAGRMGLSATFALALTDVPGTREQLLIATAISSLSNDQRHQS